MNCRHCKRLLRHVFADLGTAPPSNSYVPAPALNSPETYWPLKLYVCEACWLVQVDEYEQAEKLFSADYAYFSSVSSSWVAHAERYVDMIVQRLRLGRESAVVEIASNDGYLLQHFKKRGIPCLGIEPTSSTAAACREKGIEVIEQFFGVPLADRLVKAGRAADLVIGNNVLAHVPDVNDFVAGLARLVRQQGVITMEFPHLMRLVEECQFDTIYHEHFSYLSLGTVVTVFATQGLEIFDGDELPTHGGSLRIYAQRAGGPQPRSQAVARLLKVEEQRGMKSVAYYQGFQARADKVKNNLVKFLIEQRERGVAVAGYGAAAKSCTLLNYAGVRPDLLPYVCDAAPSKQGKYLPGCRIPILPPSALQEKKPGLVLLLPWNLRKELSEQLAGIRSWGGKFAVAVPEIEVW